MIFFPFPASSVVTQACRAVKAIYMKNRYTETTPLVQLPRRLTVAFLAFCIFSIGFINTVGPT
jgi:hypothetical protein